MKREFGNQFLRYAEGGFTVRIVFTSDKDMRHQGFLPRHGGAHIHNYGSRLPPIPGGSKRSAASVSNSLMCYCKMVCSKAGSTPSSAAITRAMRAGQFSGASRMVLAISSIVALAVATSSSRPLLPSSARRHASTFSASCATLRRVDVPSAAALPASAERCGSAVSRICTRSLVMSHWPSGSHAIRSVRSALCMVVSLMPKRRAASRVEGGFGKDGWHARRYIFSAVILGQAKLRLRFIWRRSSRAAGAGLMEPSRSLGTCSFGAERMI